MLSKTQYSSDIIGKNIGEFWKKYILREPNIRRKMRIIDSLIVSKNVSGDIEIFNIHSVTKYPKIEEGPIFSLEKMQNIQEKSLTNPKKGGKSQSAEKVARGPFCLGMVLYFMLEAIDAFKIKY